jgi:sulfate transport system permease protein
MHRAKNGRQWIGITVGMTGAFLLLVLPLALIFQQALSGGWHVLMTHLRDEEMRHAIWLTLFTTALTVPINVTFGILLAWCVTRYEFRGKQILTTLVDIPYATSPVVAGLCYVMVYGMESVVGGWLGQHDIQLMFAWPGIVMVTIFVTSPFVARILIPLMQAQGANEEYAALMLGANGWQIFRYITLPHIKWALLYGTLITNARAVGEFGAVSVVSGAIRGKTVTLALLVEQLNDDYKTVAAFTAAALLTCMALLTIVVKTAVVAVTWRNDQRATAPQLPSQESHNKHIGKYNRHTKHAGLMQ